MEPDIVAEEDVLRAQCYALLARLLAAAPTPDALAQVRALRGDASAFGRALNGLAEMARKTAPESAELEFNDLFIGVGHGELQPYASYYLTGFLYERPLAALRTDMARLGIARRDNVAEPEDHIAALCEMMAGLITGVFGRAASLAEQQEFFDRHLAPWAPRFFADLEAAQAAAFYMSVGQVGRLFLAIERDAFAMAA
jgi:TorA maturation chaperone TorD